MPEFYGENVTVQKDTGTQFLPVEDKRIRMQFRAMVHPRFWDWSRELKTWIPRLCRMVISAGINGVDLRANGTEDPGPAIANYTQRGFVVIQNPATLFKDVLPPDPDGQRRGTYLRRWKAAPRGWAYGYVWEKPEDDAGAIFWDTDNELERNFRVALRDRIIGGPPSARMRASMIREQEKTVRRRKDRTATHPQFPHIKTRFETEAKILDEMLAEHARLLALEPAAMAREAVVVELEDNEPVDLSIPEAPPAKKATKAKADATP